jgi:hypothetical protein
MRKIFSTFLLSSFALCAVFLSILIYIAQWALIIFLVVMLVRWLV